MSFQAYIDNIKAKTGLSPDDFVRRAGEKGLLGPDVKAASILDWLREDYRLGRGHGMAIVLTLQSATRPAPEPGSGLAEHFRGARGRWRAPFDGLMSEVRGFGPDVSVGAGQSYLSLLRDRKKFAIIQVTGDRLDVGLKLPGAPSAGRYERAGTWNSMITHRVRITDPEQIDDELIAQLRLAYEARR